MGAFIEQLALQGASQGLGTIMGLAMERHNDKRQLRQQGKLSEQQYGFDNRMAEENYKRQMRMWEETNYKAQIEQLEKAGLNPALLYGMGGGGGATVSAQPGHTEGAKAPQGGGEAMAGMGMGIQAGLMQAQIEVLKSQANLNNVEANKKGGVDTMEGQTRIENTKAQTAILNLEKELKAINIKVQQGTIEEQIQLITHAATKAAAEADNLEISREINRATKNSTIDRIKTEALGAAIHNLLMKSQGDKAQSDISVNNAQIKKWSEEILQGWTGLDRQERELRVKDFEAELKANYPGIGQVLGNVISKTIEKINGISKDNEYAPTEVTTEKPIKRK